jgi:hypothetical protein
MGLVWLLFERRIEERGSRRGKTLADLKNMARDREVCGGIGGRHPDAVMAQTGTEKKKKCGYYCKRQLFS